MAVLDSNEVVLLFYCT